LAGASKPEKERMFFSEEKNQKTFIPAPVRRWVAMAEKVPRAQT
jgi:hypothetical protein